MCRVPPLVLVAVAAGLVCQAVVPARATTIRPLTFSEVVERASVIVRGRVVGIRSFRNAPALAASAAQKAGRPPEAGTVSPAAAAAAERPVEVGTRGTGRMIFTTVDLEVDELLKGGGGSLVQFTIAGGTVDGLRAWIPGLPTFEANEDVMLFLRQGYERAADPVVGVNQGAFRIVKEAGAEVMLDADSHYVIGVENDRVVTRRNSRAPLASTHLVPNFIGPPTPDSPDVTASASRQANRFWTSQEPAMGLAAFQQAVAARLKR